jgi:hypothetical protein
MPWRAAIGPRPESGRRSMTAQISLAISLVSLLMTRQLTPM